jgi:NarL family two-component system response regulator LiaR
MTPIRVLVVDDHPLVREGLLAVLQSEADLEVAGQAKNGDEAVRMAVQLGPDVIVMDLLMSPKDGVEATREILQKNPEARVLILTSSTDLERILPAIQAGALGYISKEAQPNELLQAIRGLHQGGVHLPANLTRRLLRANQAATHPAALAPDLTEREIEILKLVAQGLGNEAIAERLVISSRTAGAHISHILEKLDLENRTQAALYALRQGLMSL